MGNGIGNVLGVVAFVFIGYFFGIIFTAIIGMAWVFSKEGPQGLIYFGVMALLMAIAMCLGAYEAFSDGADKAQRFCWTWGLIGFGAACAQWIWMWMKDVGEKR